MLRDQLEKNEEELLANIDKESSFRTEIEVELLANNSDAEKLSLLNSELEQLKEENHEKESEKEDITRQLDQQQKELNSLRKELQKDQKTNTENKISLSVSEKEKLKDSFEISNIISDIKKELNQLFIKGEFFKKKYSEVPTVDVYDEIIRRIEEDKKKIMKGGTKKV